MVDDAGRASFRRFRGVAPLLRSGIDADPADYLEEIEDDEAAQALRAAGARGQSLARMRGAAYANTAHVYGFTEEGGAAAGRVPIRPAHSIEADPLLVGRTIKVTLDGFRVEEYPGLGQHTVLFDFQGREQAGAEAQDLQFGSVLTVNDGDNAAVNGFPIFTGLTVPGDGLSPELLRRPHAPRFAIGNGWWHPARESRTALPLGRGRTVRPGGRTVGPAIKLLCGKRCYFMNRASNMCLDGATPLNGLIDYSARLLLT